MRILELKNVTGTVFKLNLDMVVSFAPAEVQSGSLMEGTLHVSAGGINFQLDKASADLFLAAVENDVLLPPAVDCPVVPITLGSIKPPESTL